MNKHRPKKHKPWPKVKDLGINRDVVDKQRVGEEFLDGPDYSFRDFCLRSNYDSSARAAEEFPVKKWQALWLKKQVALQDEGILGRATDIRKSVLNRRLDFVENWGKNVEDLNKLYKFHVAYQIFMGNKAIEEMKNNKIPTYKPDPYQFAALSQAAKNVQALEQSALLVPQTVKMTDMIPIAEQTPDERDEDLDYEELTSMPVVPLQPMGVPADKMVEMLASWFDQNQKTHDDIKAAEESEESGELDAEEEGV